MFTATLFLSLEAILGCSDYDKLEQCELKLAKHPVSNTVTVAYGGYSRSQCVDMMYEFKWALGLYCPDSLFCGLGLDLDKNYFSESFEVVPVTERCQLIVNKNSIKCEIAEDKLYDSGILLSETFPVSCMKIFRSLFLFRHSDHLFESWLRILPS